VDRDVRRDFRHQFESSWVHHRKLYAFPALLL
jgi:hypothetical protein